MIEYICKQCGISFLDYPSCKRKFCSHSCATKNQNIIDKNLRFAARTKRTFKLTGDALAYIDGLILGDACIQKGTPRLTQTFAKRYLEWTNIIRKDLADFGISSKITEYSTFDNRTNKTYEMAALQTLGYVQFEEFRERWYPKGKKIVPKDLMLPSCTIKNWYLGDGSCSGKQLKLSTDSFDAISLSYLKEKLEKLGFNPWISQNRIFLSRAHEMVKFFDIIGEVPSCFFYKVKMKKDLLNVVRCIPWNDDDMKILKEKYLHVSVEDLAKELNRKKKAIYMKASDLGLSRRKQT